MCYDVISCPGCGEWLDEFSASIHQCRSIPVEEEVGKKRIEEIYKQQQEPILVPISSKRRSRITATNH